MDRLTESRKQVLKVFNERVVSKMTAFKYSEIIKMAGEVQVLIDNGDWNMEEALREVLGAVAGVVVEPDCNFGKCDHGRPPEVIEIIQSPQVPGEIETCSREASCGHH